MLEDKISIKTIIANYFEKKGITGLVNQEIKCSCQLDSILHCESTKEAENCEPAYAVLCDGSLRCCSIADFRQEPSVCSVPCLLLDEALLFENPSIRKPHTDPQSICLSKKTTNIYGSALDKKVHLVIRKPISITDVFNLFPMISNHLKTNKTYEAELKEISIMASRVGKDILIIARPTPIRE